MNLRQRLGLLIAGGPAALRQAKANELTPFQAISLYRAGQPIWTDMTVRKATRDGYKLSIHVYRAVRLIVQAASAVPWVVQRRTRDGWERIPEHPLQLLLEKPSKWMSGQDLMELTIAHLQLVGNSLWQPVIVRGEPRELWAVMPDKVQPIPSKRPGEWLQAWRVDLGEDGVKFVEPDAFIHHQLLDPGNPYWGIGPLQVAARTVDVDNEQLAWNKTVMQHRGVPDGVITHEAIMTREEFQEALQRVEEQYQGRRNSRKPWVLGAGAKWQAMALTPVEMDWLQSQLKNKRDVAEAFGISPIFLGDLEQSSYNNMREARKSLYEDVVLPLLADVRSTLNATLVPYFGDDIWLTFDTSAIEALREDYGRKTEQARILWGMGVPFDQINEQLELGFEPFPGSDVGYLPFSVVPSGSIGLVEEQARARLPYVRAQNWTEEQIATYWRAVDRKRQAWWTKAARQILPLFEAESEAVTDAISKAQPGEMQIVADRVIDDQVPTWEHALAQITADLIEDFGGETAVALGAETKPSAASGRKPQGRRWNWDPFSEAARMFIVNFVARQITGISDTTKQAVRAAILAGWDENEGSVQIAKRIRDVYQEFSARRSMVIARTAVGSASGFGQREAAKQSGVVQKKRWISSRDDRVRDSHAAMDGEVQNLDDPYSNGLMHPGDPDGPAGEVIQCRCVEAYETE